MLYSTIVLVACYVTGSAGAFVGSPAAGRMQQSRVLDVAGSQLQMAERNMLSLKGKVAFVAGVADSSGYGWAICKALAEAGVEGPFSDADVAAVLTSKTIDYH